MSQENVGVVEAALKAFAGDGLDAFAEYFTDDTDYRAIEGAPDDRGPMRGREAVRAYVQDWLDTFDDLRIEDAELIDAGESKVIAVLRVSGRARLSGVETDLSYAVLYTIRDGKIARGREYATRDEALQAAGLKGSAISQEAVAVVQGAFEAWSRAGIEALLGFIDPGIEWMVRPDLPDAGVYRGHEELRQLLARFEEVLEDQWVEPQEFIDAGEGCVIVPLHWGGRGRLSGVEVSERQGETWLFRVQHGKVTQIREFRHKSEALEAAGLGG